MHMLGSRGAYVGVQSTMLFSHVKRLSTRTPRAPLPGCVVSELTDSAVISSCTLHPQGMLVPTQPSVWPLP